MRGPKRVSGPEWANRQPAGSLQLGHARSNTVPRLTQHVQPPPCQIDRCRSALSKKLCFRLPRRSRWRHSLRRCLWSDTDDANQPLLLEGKRTLGRKPTRYRRAFIRCLWPLIKSGLLLQGCQFVVFASETTPRKLSQSPIQ